MADASAKAAELLEFGYCLFPLRTEGAPPGQHPNELRAAFLAYLRSIPEYETQGRMSHGQ